MPPACKASADIITDAPLRQTGFPSLPSQTPGSESISRDAYVEYLEEKLERIVNSCLEMSCFSDRLSKLESLVSTDQTVKLEPKTQTTSASQGSCGEMAIIKNRLLILEEKVNRFMRYNSVSAEQNHALISRVNEVEKTCMKLADDSMAAIQSIHGDLSSLKSQTAAESESKLGTLETRLSQKITDSIDQVTLVLRKLIAFQKILYNRTEETRANTPVLSTKSAAIQELYREIEYMQNNKMS